MIIKKIKNQTLQSCMFKGTFKNVLEEYLN